jgi:hypothetical protein
VKVSLTRAEVIVTALFDVSQPNNFAFSRACCPPVVADIRGENEMVPDSWQVTAPGAAPRYRCARAAAGPATTPRYATRTTMVVANTIGTSGLRRMKTFSVSTVPLCAGPS